MRKQRGNVEMIEVFAPDDGALWSDAASSGVTPTDQPTGQGSSRTGLVTLGLVAVVGVIAGVIALTGNPDSDSVTTTTIVATPTTQRPLLDPTASTHSVIDDPALTAYSADVVTPPAGGQQVQVWTDGTAVGPIVIIELHPHAYEAYGIVGATRDVVEGVEVVRAKAYCPSTVGISSRCEKLTSEVAIDDDWSVTVLATRVKDSVFATIVSSVQVTDGKLGEKSDVMAGLELGLTFEDESLDGLIFGRVESAVRYLTADGEVVTLYSAAGDTDHRLAAVRYLATDAQPSIYERTYGHLWAADESIVVWEDEDRLLSLVGPIDAAELSLLSRQARAVSTAEWTRLVYGLRPDYTLGDFETLATGHATNTELWRAGPQIAERGGRTEYLWWWTVPGLADVTESTAASSRIGTRPNVDTLVVPGATFVFVSHPYSAGTVTVRTATGVEYVAELVQPFPTQSAAYMTVARIEDPGPVTVSIDGMEVEQ